jgi:hypothetical protein
MTSDLVGSTVLSAWLGAGPTGHAMIILSRCTSREVVCPFAYVAEACDAGGE